MLAEQEEKNKALEELTKMKESSDQTVKELQAEMTSRKDILARTKQEITDTQQEMKNKEEMLLALQKQIHSDE